MIDTPKKYRSSRSLGKGCVQCPPHRRYRAPGGLSAFQAEIIGCSRPHACRSKVRPLAFRPRATASVECSMGLASTPMFQAFKTVTTVMRGTSSLLRTAQSTGCSMLQVSVKDCKSPLVFVGRDVADPILRRPWWDNGGSGALQPPKTHQGSSSRQIPTLLILI